MTASQRLNVLPINPLDQDDEEQSTSNVQPDSQAHAIRTLPLGHAKRRTRSSSFVAVLSDLGIGESASRPHALADDMTLAYLRDNLSELKSLVANNIKASVATAAKETDGKYRVSTGEVITTDGRIFIVAIVTRTA